MSLPLVNQYAPQVPRRASERAERVLMICPPYQTTALSSLSTAHLATLVRDAGVACSEAYLHFVVARMLGPDVYKLIASGKQGLLGELLFAEALHGTVGEFEQRLSDLVGSRDQRQQLLGALTTACLEFLESSKPTLVGITTSCNQTLPALWLARIIKQHDASVCVVLGGSACAEPMGVALIRAYPQVDYVVSGYGEEPLLLLAEGARPAEQLLRSYRTPDLDRLPLVDYSAFLEQSAEFADANLWLSFESSRGCWWGVKNHCTFCGLNGAEMKFFEKSSQRVVSEVRSLWQRHKRNLFATDTIMPRKHLSKVLPELAREPDKPGLFYEVKVNMSAADLATLGRANVKAIQPGIESLSTHLLTLMKKGVTTIQNLALMKYCREQGIAVGWNQLCGIPGETLGDYEAQIELMAKIPQLPPPETVNPVRIDRYSPYFKAYSDFGWQHIEPLEEYRGLHPQLSDAELMQVAYHFKGVGGVTSEAYLTRLSEAVDSWNQRFRNGEGFYIHPTNGLVRNHAQGATRLKGGERLERILECTHEIALLPRVLEHARCQRAALESLVQQGLLYIEGGRVLNLAVRIGMRDGA